MSFEPTSDQIERAEEILKKLEANSIQSPKAILPNWRAAMSWEQFDHQAEYDVYEESSENQIKKWVATSNIVGPLGDSSDRDTELPTRADDLKPDRLEKILLWIIEGDFEIDYDEYDLPHFVEFDEKFYVTKDGRHRSIACKAVGIEEIWGRVAVVR